MYKCFACSDLIFPQLLLVPSILYSFDIRILEVFQIALSLTSSLGILVNPTTLVVVYENLLNQHSLLGNL